MQNGTVRDLHHFDRKAQDNLNEIIKQMAESKTPFDKELTKDIVSKLTNIYEGLNLRHSYSEITKIIIEYCKAEKTEQTLSLQQNLKEILEYINITNKNTELYDCVWKLYDHINMEIYRWNHYSENIDESLELNETMKACSKQLELATQDVTFIENVADVTKEMQEIKKKYKDASRKLIYANRSAKSLHTQLVSVLGVFSAIILSFFGGFSYFTSIFSNIKKIPVSEAVFITSIIGFVMYNIIIYLLKFIAKYLQNLLLDSENDDINASEVHNSNKKECDGKYIWSNIAICILIITSFIWYIKYDYNTEKNEQNKSEQSQTVIITETSEDVENTDNILNSEKNICIEDLNN